MESLVSARFAELIKKSEDYVEIPNLKILINYVQAVDGKPDKAGELAKLISIFFKIAKAIVRDGHTQMITLIYEDFLLQDLPEAAVKEVLEGKSLNKEIIPRIFQLKDLTKGDLLPVAHNVHRSNIEPDVE